MLDCERCKMCIRYEVAVDAGLSKQFGEHIGVALCRRWNPYGFACEPSGHLFPGACHLQRPLKHPRIRGQSQKSQQTRPRQPDSRRAVDLPVEPFTRRRVLLGSVDMGIDENVDIDQDHLNASPSTTARTSATLSILGISSAPASTDLVRNGLRGFGRESISRNPRRNTSLIRSLRLVSRLRRNRSSVAATSSSMVSVVLTHQDITYLMP